jgi:hypothetical protein
MISLIEGCYSKVLNQGFLSWFPWSRDAAVRYWTKSFFLVQYLTAVSLDQVNHDRNPWFSTLLQHPSIKEIIVETLGSVPYCQRFYHDFLDQWMMQYATEQRISIMISLVEGYCSQVQNQGFLSWFPWSRDIEILGSVPYCSIPRSRKSW